jgi:outer membrane receptor protein involved in Fe transport
MFRKLLVAFAALLLLPALLLAQDGKLRGKVTDRETGDALIGANVQIEGTNMGAATDVNGEYVILSVPPAIYTVKVTYIGYTPTTVSNIRVNSNITTTYDFKLASSAVQIQAVEIVAERPLIQRNTTNTIRVTQQEEVQYIPFRGVQNIVALSAGAVQQGGTLYVRGGRAGEIAYYVDGANATNPLFGSENYGAIREAIEEVQLQTGGFTAELGGANSGIVRTTTRSGGSQLKISADYLTDDFAKPGKKFLNTSAYGYKNGVGTISGPVINGIRFFAAGQFNYWRDRQPMWLTPFSFDGLVNDGLNLSADAGKALPGPIAFMENYLPNAWLQDIQGQGNILFDLKQLANLPIKVRVNGLYDLNTSTNGATWPGALTNVFRNPDKLSRNRTETYSGGIKLTHIVSQTTFYEVGVSMQNRYATVTDPTFGDNFYAYVDSAANAQAGFGKGVDDWINRYAGPPAISVIQKFLINDPNAPINTYSKNLQSSVSAAIDFTSQINSRWELKAGGSIDAWTMRSYAIGSISALMNFLDPTRSGTFAADNVVYGADLAAGRTVDDGLRRARWISVAAINAYGYDYKGNQTDGFSIPGATVDKPYKPTFASAYLQNKFEFNDLILNFGLRYEYVDPKMKMMDPTLNSLTGQLDYQNVPVNAVTGLIDESLLKETQSFSFLLPRLSFSFPVSDRTVFYTQFGKYVQMPSLNQLYNSSYQFSSWMNPNTRSFSGGSLGFAARPERTTLFEVGIRQVLTSNLAFTLTGFYKDNKDQLQLRRLYNSIGNPITLAYQNTDFATTKGLEFTIQLRRTERLQVNLNYTLSDARGTGATSGSNAVATSDEMKARFPNFVAPQPYNQTHRGSVILDYRFAKGDGGMILEGLGASLIMSFNSGHPYTMIQEPLNLGQATAWNIGVYPLLDARFRNPVEPVNASTTPWVFNMDLNISKMIYLGGLDFEIYANVLNLLNTQQIVNVFPNTGTPYDDGWLKASAAQPYKAIPNYEAFYRAINLSNRFGIMGSGVGDVFGTPRQIRVGVRMEL